MLASDAPSAYGLRPDWIAVDELAEWRTRTLWDSLWSATGKRPRCRMLVISTAGWDRTSIAWEVRSIAELETDWLLQQPRAVRVVDQRRVARAATPHAAGAHVSPGST